MEPISGCKVFGAFKAFYGIEGVTPVIHGPIGCYWGTLYHQAAQDENSLKATCSAIYDRDVVFGAEDKLEHAIEVAKKYYNPKMIAILGCCVPSIIGDDIKTVRKHCDIPSFYVDAAGFKGTEWEGYEDALLEFLPIMKDGGEEDNKINILGFDTVTPKTRADIKEIKRLLALSGYGVNAVLAVGTTIKQIERMPSVKKNIVIGGYGLRLAKAMEKEFGTPYEIVDAEEDVTKSLERAYLMIQRIYDMPVGIVADYARATALTKFMEVELGCDVVVSAITSGSPVHPEMDEDLFEIHNQLRNADVRSDRLRLILGTSFQKRIAEELDTALIRVAYPAHDEFSLYDDAPYMGYRGMIVLVEKILNLFLNKYPKEDW
jgi:nitrogenase molybdenum-iron protein beta chain